MPKQGLSLKLDSEKIQELKKIAQAEGKTITDVLTEGVFATKNQFILETQVKELTKSLAELTEKFERATGRKVKTTKRISIPLTDREFTALDDLAHKSKISKAQLMRQVLLEKKIPALIE